MKSEDKYLTKMKKENEVNASWPNIEKQTVESVHNYQGIPEKMHIASEVGKQRVKSQDRRGF